MLFRPISVEKVVRFTNIIARPTPAVALELFIKPTKSIATEVSINPSSHWLVKAGITTLKSVLLRYIKIGQVNLLELEVLFVLAVSSLFNVSASYPMLLLTVVCSLAKSISSHFIILGVAFTLKFFSRFTLFAVVISSLSIMMSNYG